MDITCCTTCFSSKNLYNLSTRRSQALCQSRNTQQQPSGLRASDTSSSTCGRRRLFYGLHELTSWLKSMYFAQNKFLAKNICPISASPTTTTTKSCMVTCCTMSNQGSTPGTWLRSLSHCYFQGSVF